MITRTRLGEILDAGGQIGLPLAVGALAGFFAADRGVRLLPTLLSAVTLSLGACLLLIAIGRWLKGKAYVDSSRGTLLRKRVVAALFLALVAGMVQLAIFYTQGVAPLTELDTDAFDATFATDAQRYVELDAGMERLVRTVAAMDIQGGPDATVLSADDEQLLLEVWAAFYDHAMAQDQIRLFYEDYYRFDPSRAQRSYHLRSFLLTYAAELSVYEKSARLAALVLPNKNAQKFLDAPHADHGLGENTFSHFREQLQGARDQARVVAGEAYLKTLDKTLGARRDAAGLGVTWLWDRIDRHLAMIGGVAPLDRAALGLRADGQAAKRGARRVWFPAQKEVADWMGDVKLRRAGWYLITHEQLEEMDPHLEPGDVLLGRKNWYLSNVGLPGFWPHGILYIGSPEKLSAFMDDSAVTDWLEAQTGLRQTFAQYMAATFPERWLRFTVGDHDQPYRVIEAIGEGVVFNTLDHAAGDYLAAIRPAQVGKLAKAQAVIEAFRHLDKPYDFDFDFATDHALVCTELVWQAWRPQEGKAGVEFPLTSVAGRKSLAPTDIVKLMDHGWADEEGRPLLEYVYFLDASEKERRAFVSDEAALRATWKRPKWDTAQE